MKKYLWKFLEDGLVSAHGNFKWRVGRWEKISGELEICGNGFHASKHIRDAMGYVSGSILAKVEVRGQSVIQNDKQAWSEMKIVKAYHWTKEDSVAFSIYAAELCLANFEKLYPKDKRPREAIEAAKAYNKNPCDETQTAARSAAEAAEAAVSAAEAAWSAAEAAAWAAAEKRTKEKIQRWLRNHVKKLKKYEEE